MLLSNGQDGLTHLVDYHGNTFVMSFLSCTLYHGILLAGVLEAGGRASDGPAV